MKKIVILLLVFPILTFAQDFKQEFNEKFKSKDYQFEEVKTILDNWKIKSKSDVDYYIAAFNFYFAESQKEIIQLAVEAPDDDREALVLKDSLGNSAGYMYAQKMNNDSLFAISQNTIDEGIKLFPNRLDLRFGKIHTLGKYERFEEFSTEILKTIEYSKKIKHQWLWAENKKRDDPEDFFIDAVQRYQNTLYQLELDENMKKIAKKMYETFPSSVFTISSYGMTFLIENKFKEALELYKKAEKINPNDPIVLNNIGLIYERLDDIDQAKKYYKKIISVGDDKSKAFAQKKLDQLK